MSGRLVVVALACLAVVVGGVSLFVSRSEPEPSGKVRVADQPIGPAAPSPAPSPHATPEATPAPEPTPDQPAARATSVRPRATVTRPHRPAAPPPTPAPRRTPPPYPWSPLPTHEMPPHPTPWMPPQWTPAPTPAG